MIKLSPVTALMLYLFMTLATLLSIWSWYHFRSRKKKVILAEQELKVCEYCHFAYLDQISKDVSQCPQCQLFNKRHS